MPDKGIKDAIDLPILQIHCILQKSLNIDSKKKSLQGCCLQALVASDVFVADADVRKMAGLLLPAGFKVYKILVLVSGIAWLHTVKYNH
jgi:hypothetical protein